MPEFSPVSFSEVWETTLKNHADDTFLIFENLESDTVQWTYNCLLYTSPSPRD